MPDITDTLAQRGNAYGDFREQGRITQNLKRAMQDSPNWHRIPSYMREGLDMIQHKISRMLNGDALYDDNIHDIIGYAKLMQDRAKQDRDAGMVFEVGGDPLYPTYAHEDRGVLVLDQSVDEMEDITVRTSDGSQVPDPAYMKDPVRATLSNRNETMLDTWDSFRGKVAWGYTENPGVAAQMDLLPLEDRLDFLQEAALLGYITLSNMRKDDQAGVYCLGAFEIPKN